MILAIDPGLSGAVALYDPDMDFLYTERLPVRWRLVNKKKHNEIDLPVLCAWIHARKVHGISRIVMENPTAMPGAGATSQFNFGNTCGQINGLLTGMFGIQPTLVHPWKWKHLLNVPSDKRRSVARAKVFFPNRGFNTEGEAEAAMIAYYIHMVDNGQLGVTGKKALKDPTAPVSRKRRPGRPKRAGVV